jgi:coenzyme F420-0:L-glutamate ligase/coenzyme F420-1:gamma-L-glutamate ligase
MTHPARQMTVTALPGIPTVRPGDDLAPLVVAAIGAAGLVLAPGDVLVVAQKIVSKAEGRLVKLADVAPSARAQELAAIAGKDPRIVELILRESREVLRCRRGVIVVEHLSGLIMANAGIDASNVEAAEDTVLLLPRDADASAHALRRAIEGLTGVAPAVIVNDSFGRAWRNGTIGTAIGVAGLVALDDLRGQPDRNGRVLVATEVAVADEVASAASLMMGQAAESCPVVLVRGAPLRPGEGRLRDLLRDRAIDLFR